MEIDTDIYFKQLGKNIAKMRERKKITQYKLAKDIMSDQSNLAKIEQGKINTTFKTIVKISIALNCKVKDLFDF